MNRRQFLATGGLATGLALGGCTGTEETPTSDEESPDSDTPTPTATTRGDVTVSDIVVRKAVTYESWLGSGGVVAAEGKQYVVASVDADRDLSRDSMTFEADGESWASGIPAPAGGMTSSVAGHQGGAVGETALEPPGWYVAFEVPAPLEAPDARIRLAGSGRTWPLPEDVRARLATAGPTFDLASLSVPDTVTQGETLSVALSAENTSDVDGRFLAAVYWPTERVADDDESHVVERETAAGETTTATLDIDTGYTTREGGEVTLRVAGHVSASRVVTVEMP